MNVKQQIHSVAERLTVYRKGIITDEITIKPAKQVPTSDKIQSLYGQNSIPKIVPVTVISPPEKSSALSALPDIFKLYLEKSITTELGESSLTTPHAVMLTTWFPESEIDGSHDTASCGNSSKFPIISPKRENFLSKIGKGEPPPT